MAEPRFIIRPSGPLEGELRIKGAKNSVLKLMVATLLAEGTHVLENVPDITDVHIMSELLESMGATVQFERALSTLYISVPETADVTPIASYKLVMKIRASIVVLGALLGRCGRAELAQPGGDDFGQRPVDYHIEGLTALGAIFKEEHGYISASCLNLTGSRVVLEFPSHTATDNLLMAAVLAKGRTIIENAAREPEVIDLADMLVSMGAKISGAGTSHLEIEGVEMLRPAHHRVIPDRVEAASYIAAVAVSGGRVTLLNARVNHMDMLLRKVGALGVTFETDGEGLEVSSCGKLTAVDVATLPYPGVATDYQPLIVTMLAVASGVSVVTENLFSGRFRYIEELRRMGANISTEGHHVVVRGVPRLCGARVRASDIRAGVALVIAGLVADGETEVIGVEHIERGYERIHERLASLGAQIQRVE